VTDLAKHWLDASPATLHRQVQIVSCGPQPMLEASARLAQAYDVPCQISVEEYMACGVGGCAGCTVLVHEPGGSAMRRVCVDGPVFDANWIYPPTQARAG
jgi:dihydroorotate dehydrogenase electron transfer subunit